jgi:hypothetical protein
MRRIAIRASGGHYRQEFEKVQPSQCKNSLIAVLSRPLEVLPALPVSIAPKGGFDLDPVLAGS